MENEEKQNGKEGASERTQPEDHIKISIEGPAHVVRSLISQEMVKAPPKEEAKTVNVGEGKEE